MDPLSLAVLLGRAFEVMLERWCGLGLWEYADELLAVEGEPDITSEIEATYTMRCGLATFHFEFPTSVEL